ncbi:hypothetical protein F9Z43_07940 [Pseudomonas monteilii]|uniref:Uncharacterized protein n=1 Tax=Pseudomonas monteilii TaxID=76759 RepID=A0A7X3F195_9PSED|nr:hypothetical protein [Pseudomonas monteilii]
MPASSRQAPSHRVHTDFEYCAVPVGAGLPAKRPVQAVSAARRYRHPGWPETWPGKPTAPPRSTLR